MSRLRAWRRFLLALARIGRFCDFRPAASTPEQIEQLLAAIDCTANPTLSPQPGGG